MADSIAERIARIERECAHAWSLYGIDSWQRARLEEWRGRERLSDKQEAVLEQIERKVFGER